MSSNALSPRGNKRDDHFQVFEPTEIIKSGQVTPAKPGRSSWAQSAANTMVSYQQAGVEHHKIIETRRITRDLANVDKAKAVEHERQETKRVEIQAHKEIKMNQDNLEHEKAMAEMILNYDERKQDRLMAMWSMSSDPEERKEIMREVNRQFQSWDWSDPR